MSRPPSLPAAALPVRVFLLVMLLTFVSEGVIMLALPHISPGPPGSLAESLTDSTLLSLLLAPGVWVLVVRPLRNLSRDRGELIGRLFRAQEEERGRIARDLHDELGQHLTALLVGLKAIEQAPPGAVRAENVRPLHAVAHTCLDEVRRLARGLRPAALDEFGLRSALERMGEEFGATHNVRATLTIELPEGRRYRSEHELALYRLVQESLTNVARHARAAAVTVRLRDHDGWLSVLVQDDGVGPGPGAQSLGSLGMGSMIERARQLGGSCTVGEAPGGGTLVEAWLPATPPEEPRA